jgi:hypothetical protein
MIAHCNQIAEQLGIGRGTTERAFNSLSQKPLATPATPDTFHRAFVGLNSPSGPFPQPSVFGKASDSSYSPDRATGPGYRQIRHNTTTES